MTDTANGAAAAVVTVPPVSAARPTLPPLLLPVLAVAVASAVYLYGRRYRCCGRPAGSTLKGPVAYPIVGTMHVMRGHRHRPFRRFTELARQYGPVYLMRMGATPCVIVNDYPSIKEVLITNGSKFGCRLNFARYNALFDGDRNNCEYNINTHHSLIV